MGINTQTDCIDIEGSFTPFWALYSSFVLSYSKFWAPLLSGRRPFHSINWSLISLYNIFHIFLFRSIPFRSAKYATNFLCAVLTIKINETCTQFGPLVLWQTIKFSCVSWFSRSWINIYLHLPLTSLKCRNSLTGADEPFWTNWRHTPMRVNWPCDVALSNTAGK